MPSPFPGMDPYLEHPAVFPDFHNSLITYLREALNAVLPRSLYAISADRVWIGESERVVGPDVSVARRHDLERPASSGGAAVAELVAAQPLIVQVPQEQHIEPYLEVRSTSLGRPLVAVVEVLSPTNKRGGDGRDEYLRKQREYLDSQVHMLEIDLLRGGQHVTAVPAHRLRAAAGEFEYHVCVRRHERPRAYEVYPFRLEQPMPIVSLPLSQGVPDQPINLRPLLDRVYDAGRYGDLMDYTAQPETPLTAEQFAWSRGVLRDRGILSGEPITVPQPEG